MKDYFEGALLSLDRRVSMVAQRLDPGSQPDGRPRVLLDALHRQAARLVQLREGVRKLREDPTLDVLAFADQHLESYRRLVRELSTIEAIYVAMCDLWREDDEVMQGVVGAICRESGLLGISQPVVALYSHDYYHVLVKEGVIYAPRLERHFLLNMPDLYHEIGHIVLDQYGRTVYGSFRIETQNHFQQEVRVGALRQDPLVDDGTLNIAYESWIGYWLIEFICDAIATYMVGPAYGWGHFHLCASSVPSVYVGALTHPADQARFQIIEACLRNLPVESSGVITERWETLIESMGATKPPHFDRIYPPALISRLASVVKEGLEALGATLYSEEHVRNGAPVAAMLNEAWSVFWSDPAGYAEWESDQIDRLRGAALAT